MNLKKSLLFFIILLILTPSSFLRAQDKLSSTDAAQIKLNMFRILFAQQIKEASESVKQKRAELQSSLQSVSHEKRRALVLRIYDKMADINRLRTERMMNNLEKMSSLLDRFTKRVATAKAKGIDTTILEQATSEAGLSIDLARNSVLDQTTKIYTINVEEQRSLRPVVSQTLTQMQSDLKSTQSFVVEAKQKVIRVTKELVNAGLIRSVTKTNEATLTATLTPTP